MSGNFTHPFKFWVMFKKMVRSLTISFKMLSTTAANLKAMIAMQNIGLQVLNSWMVLSYWARIPKMLSLLVKPLSDAPLSLQLIIR